MLHSGLCLLLLPGDNSPYKLGKWALPGPGPRAQFLRNCGDQNPTTLQEGELGVEALQ